MHKIKINKTAIAILMFTSQHAMCVVLQTTVI